ncbi:histidinol dehydrogenase [Acuticoccus sediminis]
MQVIAAMVFGTQTIAPVGMLAGPGNACVREALTRLTRSTNEVNTSKNAR